MIRGLFRILLLWAAWIAAVAAECASEPSRSPDMLVIYSTTDTGVFEPVLHDFHELHPGLKVCYVELEAAPLYERFLREAERGEPRADVLLSSSMDLQVKLVNDGYAQPHLSENARALPNWARWRDEAFGFTLEPVVMVFNGKSMAGRSIPRSRPELLSLLKSDPARWHRRIGTYNILNSSVGYLLASQDARQDSASAALIETFGDVGLQLEERTADLLDRLESGDLAIGYNLLGSYAQARIDAGAPLVVVYPEDYTVALSRTAVLPRSAPNPEAAHRFLEYLLSVRGQQVLTTHGGLPAIRREIGGVGNRLGAEDMQVGLLRPIALGPGLLVYLDQQKRRRLLGNWRAVIDMPSP